MSEHLKFARSGNTVRVTLPINVANDIKQVQKVVASLATKLGHTGCFSGFDIFFQQEVEYVVNAHSLEIEGR